MTAEVPLVECPDVLGRLAVRFGSVPLACRKVHGIGGMGHAEYPRVKHESGLLNVKIRSNFGRHSASRLRERFRCLRAIVAFVKSLSQSRSQLLETGSTLLWSAGLVSERTRSASTRGEMRPWLLRRCLTALSNERWLVRSSAGKADSPSRTATLPRLAKSRQEASPRVRRPASQSMAGISKGSRGWRVASCEPLHASCSAPRRRASRRPNPE